MLSFIMQGRHSFTLACIILENVQTFFVVVEMKLVLKRFSAEFSKLATS